MEQDLADKIISGCRLEKLLGRGGMGSVYKAHHLNLDIPVAVKFLDKQLASSPELIERFILEARAAARLDSPYIVRVFQVGEEDSLYFIQMEFVEGESLAQKLKREAPLDVGTALLFLYQIAMGLAAAHQANIIHRDIKPENILMSGKGILKITDFGLAKSLQSTSNLTRSGQILGTPYYLSPEQCEGKASDARSDIYSLGVTFYYMVTGALPFQGETPIGIAVARLRFDPPLPRQIKADIPEDVEKLTMKMMARAPEDRYPDTSAILQDVMALMAHYDVSSQMKASTAHFPMISYVYSQESKAGTGSSPAVGSKSDPAAATEIFTAEAESKDSSLTMSDDANEIAPSNPTEELTYTPVKPRPGIPPAETMATEPLRTLKRDTPRRSETLAKKTPPSEETGKKAAPKVEKVVESPKPLRRGRWLSDLICACAIVLLAFIVLKKEYSSQIGKIQERYSTTLKEAYAPQLNNLPEWSDYRSTVANLGKEPPQATVNKISKFLSLYPKSCYAKLLKELRQELVQTEPQQDPTIPKEPTTKEKEEQEWREFKQNLISLTQKGQYTDILQLVDEKKQFLPKLQKDTGLHEKIANLFEREETVKLWQDYVKEVHFLIRSKSREAQRDLERLANIPLPAMRREYSRFQESVKQQIADLIDEHQFAEARKLGEEYKGFQPYFQMDEQLQQNVKKAFKESFDQLEEAIQEEDWDSAQTCLKILEEMGDKLQNFILPPYLEKARTRLKEKREEVEKSNEKSSHNTGKKPSKEPNPSLKTFVFFTAKGYTGKKEGMGGWEVKDNKLHGHSKKLATCGLVWAVPTPPFKVRATFVLTNLAVQKMLKMPSWLRIKFVSPQQEAVIEVTPSTKKERTLVIEVQENEVEVTLDGQKYSPSSPPKSSSGKTYLAFVLHHARIEIQKMELTSLK